MQLAPAPIFLFIGYVFSILVFVSEILVGFPELVRRRAEKERSLG